MDNKEIISVTNILTELLNLLYLKKENYYLINVNWFANNTNISIQERFANNKIFNIDIPGNIEVYSFITKNISDLVINNIDAIGCLTTSFLGNSRRIDGQNIRTKNIEINIPIYNRAGLVRAEENNNFMLEKLSNPNTKIKTLTKKDCI